MYENFKPTIWAAGIEKSLHENCVFLEDCNQEYEGEVNKPGKTVKILAVGKPTIYEVTGKELNKDINAPENIPESSIDLTVNQVAYFNFMVDDIDQAQAKGGIMDEHVKESGVGVANTIDKYIAKFATDDSVSSLYSSPVTIVESEAKTLDASGAEKANTKYVLDVVDEAVELLQERNVPDGTPIVITVSPKFFRIFKKAYRFEDTNNSNILKNGKVGMYNKVTVKVSNNVYKTGEGNKVHNIMIRTKKAIAAVVPHTHTEPYRPERRFSDAVKGFTLYDAIVARPQEIINIPVQF